MANLIGHAVDHQLKEGKVSVIELFEILSDYVNRVGMKPPTSQLHCGVNMPRVPVSR
jgi:hypothetical protein